MLRPAILMPPQPSCTAACRTAPAPAPHRSPPAPPQGLDGEATEPIVESVSEEDGEELDPEEEFAISAVVGETGGLEVRLTTAMRTR